MKYYRSCPMTPLSILFHFYCVKFVPLIIIPKTVSFYVILVPIKSTVKFLTQPSGIHFGQFWRHFQLALEFIPFPLDKNKQLRGNPEAFLAHEILAKEFQNAVFGDSKSCPGAITRFIILLGTLQLKYRLKILEIPFRML